MEGCEQFWDTLSSSTLTFEQKLNHIRTTEYDLFEESQPWCILQYFADIVHSDNPIEDAFKVAAVFKERLGLLIVERESSYCLGRYITVMDELDRDLKEDSPFWIGIFRYAFKKTGFLKADDADPHVLYTMYSNRWYDNFEDTRFTDLFEPCPFGEELVMRLFHPDRVSKWLESNPDKDIDAYLN